MATLTATDQDRAAADLAWSKAGGADAGQFTLSTAGDLAFAAAPDYENPDDADGVSIEANRLSLNADPVLWYAMPAASWNEALPVGNGRLAGMVFGNTGRERIQLNEETLWAGAPYQRDILGAHRHLPEIRRLLFAGRYVEAQAMVNRELFIGGRVVRAYQTLGDLWIDLGTESQAGYRRELDLETGIARTEWTFGTEWRSRAKCSRARRTGCWSCASRRIRWARSPAPSS